MDKDKPLPLTNEAQPNLDVLHPGYNFMIVTETGTGQKKLVGTRKSITLRPLYSEMVIEDPLYLEGYAEILAERLYDQYTLDRWRHLGQSRGRGGIGYVVDYHTPEEWTEIKIEERLIKLNTPVKPTRKNKRSKGGA